jgi:predicted dinucleotide-binding enzyme
VDQFHLSVVKAFNQLHAEQLRANPALNRQRQVVFVSSNDADDSATVAAVATQLGFTPVELQSVRREFPGLDFTLSAASVGAASSS